MRLLKLASRLGQPGRQQEQYCYHSRALEVVRADLGQIERPAVIDLGPALGDNIAFFQELSCRLFVEDLRAEIAARPMPPLARDPETDPPLRFKGQLSCGAGGPVDLVLCWDLFDYLHPLELERLCESLLELTGPRTLWWLLTSDRKELPPEPGLWRISEGGGVTLEEREGPGRDAAPGLQQQLRRELAGSKARRSLRLKNGLTEQLLSWEARSTGSALASEDAARAHRSHR